MSAAEIIYEKTFRIHTFECDFNRRWKPAAFFQHLSEAAGAHAARLGWGFDAMLSQNLFWVHSRMKIKFHRFPYAGDEITIRTWPKTIQQKLFYIRDFEIVDTTGAQIATATSAWLVINASTRRLVSPLTMTISLPTLPDRAGLDEPLEKLNLPDSGEERLTLRAGYSAVDMVGHVNNSRYVEWICDSFPLDEYRSQTLDWIQVNYDHEIRPSEEVSILVNSPTDNSGIWTVSGFNRSNQTRAFESALQWRK